MTKFEKIILIFLGALILIVLVVGTIVFRQQKTINALSGGATGASNQAATQNNAKKSPSLAETIKQFSGKIENISGNKFIISTNLSDFSKPKDPEKFKNQDGPMNITDNDFEVLSKKITVNTNEKTVFAVKKLADLKVGDTVAITSDKSPHISDTITAEKITYVGTPK